MKTFIYAIFNAPFSITVRRDRRLTYGVIVFALSALAMGVVLAKYGREFISGGDNLGFFLIFFGVLLLCVFRCTEKSLWVCLKNWLGMPLVVTIMVLGFIFGRMFLGQEPGWKPYLLIAALWSGAWFLMSVSGYFTARTLDWLDARLYPKDKEG